MQSTMYVVDNSCTSYGSKCVYGSAANIDDVDVLMHECLNSDSELLTRNVQRKDRLEAGSEHTGINSMFHHTTLCNIDELHGPSIESKTANKPEHSENAALDFYNSDTLRHPPSE